MGGVYVRPFLNSNPTLSAIFLFSDPIVEQPGYPTRPFFRKVFDALHIRTPLRRCNQKLFAT